VRCIVCVATTAPTATVATIASIPIARNIVAPIRDIASLRVFAAPITQQTTPGIIDIIASSASASNDAPADDAARMVVRQRTDPLPALVFLFHRGIYG